MTPSAAMQRVVFFGNSQTVFSNRHFQALLTTPSELVAVVDAPPSKRSSTNIKKQSGTANFVEMARRRGIPAFEPPNPNLPEFVKSIAALSPDLFMAVGYTKLLKDEILSLPRALAANFHASLLPAYRGKHPVFWALRNGERGAGLTVHAMDRGLDTGDILYQVRVRTRKLDSVASLYERIMEKSVGLVGRLIKDVEQRTFRRSPQAKAGSSYYSSTKPEDFRLDWNRDAEQLRRWIHVSPGVCFCEIAGRRAFLLEARVVPGDDGAPPGVVVRIGRTSCTVAAGQGALRLNKARLEEGGEKFMAQLCGELGLKEGVRLDFSSSPR